MNTEAPTQQSASAIERHSRKCAVCHHPDRALIEYEFLRWSHVWHMARDFGIADYRTIYCHATAFGLFEQRRRNARAVLEPILENASRCVPSADAVIRALRAYTRIDDSGRWIEPPTQVVYSIERNAAPPPAAKPAVVAAEKAPDVAAAATPTLDEWDPSPDFAPALGQFEPRANPAVTRPGPPAAHRPGPRAATRYTPRFQIRGVSGLLIHGAGIRNRRISLKINGRTRF